MKIWSGELVALVSELLKLETGMLRRRLLSGPLLLLVGVALCLFYQTFSVARNLLQVQQPPSPRVHSPQCSEGVGLQESERFISALDALEAQVQLLSTRGRPRALVLTGRHVVTDTEVQLYVRVLQQMGYDVQLSRYAETSSLLRPKQGVNGLSLLFCLSSSETSCLRRVPFSQLQRHQRVNLLPQIRKAFSDAGDGQCHMFSHSSMTGSKIHMGLFSCASNQDQGSIKTTSYNSLFSLTKPMASPRDPTVVNVYILVTSLDPLLAFLHDLIVLSVNGDSGQPSRLENLRPDLLGYSALNPHMTEHIKRVIGDVLRAAVSTYEKDQTIKRCLLCYQLLTFTLLFDSPLPPTVIQVDTDWSFSALNDKSFEQKITKDLMLEDMLHFLLNSQTHVSSVTKTGDDCSRTLGVSLSEDNQLLLLQFYQQMKSPGPFHLLFPNTTSGSTSVRPVVINDLIVKTACYFELHHNISNKSAKEGISSSIRLTQNFLSKQNAMCVDPQLRQIYTDPPLSMTPPFDPQVKEYHIEVPFDTVMVRIRPEPLHLNCRAHLDEQHGPSMASLPIGLGHSRISVLVTDGGAPEAVLTIYTLHMFRESRPSLPMFGDHVMCSFTQECSLLVQPHQSCGLEPFNKSQSPPQPCNSGDKPGRWVVPCLSCLDSRTCDWREIVWQPDHCYYPLIDRPQLQSCMADRKLLFIGDSTNRGMMYFLMERVNSSLEDWEKAHDTLVYNNLNGGRTLISYSYYPQFWLEPNERPTFTESLEKLLNRSRPLSNSRQTILVVGGVQWLNTKHLRAIREALKRKNLNNIQVVIKSFGMGFHLLVDGVRSLKLREIQALYVENQNLLSTAKKYGFEVLDTFIITMGRYKEFLQGRCACHFHEVEKHLSSKPSFDSTTEANGIRPISAGSNAAVAWEHGSRSKVMSYKVKGPVNQVYSEILLSRLCSHS